MYIIIYFYLRTHGEWEITHTEIEDKNLTEHFPDGTVRVFPQIDFWIFLSEQPIKPANNSIYFVKGSRDLTVILFQYLFH